MNNTCIIALKLTNKIEFNPNVDYIGVDKGALTLAKQKIEMTQAIGDFDSVEHEDIAEIRKYAKNIEILNPIKDDSDSEHAIKKAIELGYEEIVVYGGLGGRLDHEIVNIRLCEAFPNRITFVDDYNKLTALSVGEYNFYKQYQYISVFSCGKSVISWENTKYLLDHKTLETSDLLGLSNEIEKNPAKLIVHEGKVLVIESNDKKRFPN